MRLTTLDAASQIADQIVGIARVIEDAGIVQPGYEKWWRLGYRKSRRQKTHHDRKFHAGKHSAGAIPN
jgi:hypothetical protein